MDSSSIFLTPPDELGFNFDCPIDPNQDFNLYSDNIFEGVYSQDWYHCEDKDPVWEKLNELKDELFGQNSEQDTRSTEYREREEMNHGRDAILRRLRYYIRKFSQTNEPITMLNRGKMPNLSFNKDLGMRLRNDVGQYIKIGMRKRARMIFLLCRVYVNVASNRFATKRDLYYCDIDVYNKSQTIVNALIEDLCCFTRYSRQQLHIRSCAKGLIYGRLKYKINDTIYNCMDNDDGITISRKIHKVVAIESNAQFILLVEKDATFQKLIDGRFVDKLPVIIITGKGFPDAYTRWFVKHLVAQLKIPVLGLADCNPWGLEIMCMYRYGSMAMAHEADYLVEPKVRWLGLLPSDLIRFSIAQNQMFELDEKDQRRIDVLKNRPYIKHNKKWQHELNMMKRFNRKAELQSIENFVEVYLPWKIKKGSWL